MVAAALVAEERPPATDARRTAFRGAAEAYRARSADDGDSPARRRAGGEDQLRVVDDREDVARSPAPGARPRPGPRRPRSPRRRARSRRPPLPRSASARRRRRAWTGERAARAPGPGRLRSRSSHRLAGALEADVVDVAAWTEAAREDGAFDVGHEGLGVGAAAVDGEEELARGHTVASEKNGCGPEGPQPRGPCWSGIRTPAGYPAASCADHGPR